VSATVSSVLLFMALRAFGTPVLEQLHVRLLYRVRLETDPRPAVHLEDAVLDVVELLTLCGMYHLTGETFILIINVIIV
jgi:hypothetical protein